MWSEKTRLPVWGREWRDCTAVKTEDLKKYQWRNHLLCDKLKVWDARAHLKNMTKMWFGKHQNVLWMKRPASIASYPNIFKCTIFDSLGPYISLQPTIFEQVPNIVSRREIFGPELALRFPAFCSLIDQRAAFSPQPYTLQPYIATLFCCQGQNWRSKFSDLQNAILCEVMNVHYSSALPLKSNSSTLYCLHCC